MEWFASILHVMLFRPDRSDQQGKTQTRLSFTGLTDNKGNSHVLPKLMTSKYPLAPILMELSMQMRRKGMVLNLEWVSRDLNEEADALSNMSFDGFSPDHRIPVDLSQLKFVVLNSMLDEGAAMYHALEGLKGHTAVKSLWKGATGSKLRQSNPW